MVGDTLRGEMESVERAFRLLPSERVLWEGRPQRGVSRGAQWRWIPALVAVIAVIAATVSALVGNQWGVLTIESGLVQGLGAELVFAVFLYRRWNLPVAILAGALAGVALAVNDLILWYPGAATAFAVIYTASAVVSGAVIAGLLSWFVVRGLARTGALSRFESGRAFARSAT